MEELLASAEGILTFVVSLFAGSSSLVLIVQSIFASIRNKKYAATIATANLKDSQINELEAKVIDLTKSIGYMMSAFLTQQMSSMALDANTKKEIIEIAQDIEKISSIKLNNTVKKALDIMTILDPKSVVEEKKAAILSKATEAQSVIDKIAETAKVITQELEID